MLPVSAVSDGGKNMNVEELKRMTVEQGERLKMMTVEQFVQAITDTAKVFTGQDGMKLEIPLDTTVVFIVTAGEKRFGVQVVVGEKYLAEQAKQEQAAQAEQVAQ
jgi:hypothetical protein